LAENIRPLEFEEFTLNGLLRFRPFRKMVFAGFTEVPRRLLPGNTVAKVYKEKPEEI